MADKEEPPKNNVVSLKPGIRLIAHLPGYPIFEAMRDGCGYMCRSHPVSNQPHLMSTEGVLLAVIGPNCGERVCHNPLNPLASAVKSCQWSYCPLLKNVR